MNKLGLMATPAFVLALALSAVAQEKPLTTKKENDGTVKVNVSGRLQLDYVWRSSEMEAGVVTLGTLPSGNSENTFEGYAAIRFDAELTDKVSLVIEMGTERVDGGGILAWGQASPTGGSTAQDVVLREAHVLLADFLTPNLTAQLGVSTWSFDVRGKGSSFAFDPRHSQTFTRNLAVTADVTLGANAPEELQPAGAVVSYDRDALSLQLVVLPAVIEAGDPENDEALYAADFFYKLDGKGSRVGAIIAVVAYSDVLVGGNPTNVFTLGGGAVLKGLVENLELYGEIYFQFGDAAEDVDAAGVGLQVGAEYTLEGGIKIGGNITYISGDSDTGVDDKVDTFLSYENVNDLMIIEDMYFGFDWDSNYFAFKFNGEIPLDVRGKGDLVLMAILGITRTAEDVVFASGVEEDALGTEVDFKARWAVTKQAALQAGLAFLFGSDILEESLGGPGAPDADDNATLFTVGFDVRF